GAAVVAMACAATATRPLAAWLARGTERTAGGIAGAAAWRRSPCRGARRGYRVAAAGGVHGDGDRGVHRLDRVAPPLRPRRAGARRATAAAGQRQAPGAAGACAVAAVAGGGAVAVAMAGTACR